MKLITVFGFMAVMVSPVYADAPVSGSDVEQKRLRTVSDAYSQCAAYYEVVRTSLGKSGRTDIVARAEDMKSQSNNLAVIMAEELFAMQYKDQVKATDAAKQLAESNYNTALANLSRIARQGKARISQVSAEYQTGCNTAINNPGAFSDGVLATLKTKSEDKAAEKKEAPTDAGKP